MRISQPPLRSRLNPPRTSARSWFFFPTTFIHTTCRLIQVTFRPNTPRLLLASMHHIGLPTQAPKLPSNHRKEDRHKPRKQCHLCALYQGTPSARLIPHQIRFPDSSPCEHSAHQRRLRACVPSYRFTCHLHRRSVPSAVARQLIIVSLDGNRTFCGSAEQPQFRDRGNRSNAVKRRVSFVHWQSS